MIFLTPTLDTSSPSPCGRVQLWRDHYGGDLSSGQQIQDQICPIPTWLDLLPSLQRALCFARNTSQSFQHLLDVLSCVSAVSGRQQQLIGNLAAADDPTLPNNFWPIALTPCMGKLFTIILFQQWLSFMISNKYLDKGIQKAFMARTPGCIEHHLKLATVIQNAQKKHRSLAVCWLALAIAYGSVHHSLITLSLQHYHAPPQFFYFVQHLYSKLAVSINSSHWSSPPIPLEVGVYQGDPRSVAILNTVINTMVDTIRTRPELGHQLSQNQSISLLRHAHDTCLRELPILFSTSLASC